MKKNHLVCACMVIVVSVFSLLFMGCDLLAEESAEEGKPQVLAKVGDHALTLKEFNDQMETMPPQVQMMLLQNPSLKEQYVERWVQVTLISNAAKEMKLDQDPEVKAKIKNFVNSVLAQEYIRKEVDKKLEITDEEIKAHYENNKSEFSTDEMVKASHILVKVPQDAGEDAWTEAEAKIKSILDELEKGADFGELATTHSDDPGSKAKGGDLGYFPKGRMVPEFEAVAFSLEAGKVSEPVKTAFGYHVIKVVDKKEASVKPLNEVRDQVVQKLKAEKGQKQLDELLENLKKKYPVEVNTELLSSGQGGPHGSMMTPH